MNRSRLSYAPPAVIRVFYAFLLVLGLASSLQGQHRDSLVLDTVALGIAAHIYIDSVIISASRSGFDIADFVYLARHDESLYQAFKNLRTVDHSYAFRIDFFDKKGRRKAHYTGQHRQSVWDSCRTTEIVEESVDGNYFKWKKGKRKHRYYTARLFEGIFFTRDTVCRTAVTKSLKNRSQMEIQIDELKQLMFRPGEKANIPIVGNRTAIFTEEMIDRYDLSVYSDYYQDSIPCFVFSAVAKPKYIDSRKKVVVRYMYTYFDQHNDQVLGRDYHLRFKTVLYDMDVRMSVRLRKLGESYVPAFVRYDGSWHIIARKKEIATFEARFSYKS